MASRDYMPARSRRWERTQPDEGAGCSGAEEVIDGIDQLLDEIDSVLEDQEVLANYRQRSGQ